MNRILLAGCLSMSIFLFVIVAGVVGLMTSLKHTEALLGRPATLDERAARVVGKLDANQASAYHEGLAYIHRNHLNIREFTIGQVIGDARQRRTNAYFARQAVLMRKLDVVSTTSLQVAAQLAGPYLQNAKIDGLDCSLTVDTSDSHWSNARQQKATERLALRMCDVAYRLSGENSRDLPDQGLSVYLYDRAGHELYRDGIENPEYKNPPW